MIRKMLESDLEQVLLIENDIFAKDPWPKKEYLYELNENPFSQLFVYCIDDEVVGYFDLWITYEQAQLANIGVKRSFQKKGIGQKLINYCANEAIKNECENLTLEVRVSNTPAINLYSKNDFISVSTRRHYYSDGEDAYLMIKPLGGLEYDENISD